MSSTVHRLSQKVTILPFGKEKMHHSHAVIAVCKSQEMHEVERISLAKELKVYSYGDHYERSCVPQAHVFTPWDDDGRRGIVFEEATRDFIPHTRTRLLARPTTSCRRTWPKFETLENSSIECFEFFRHRC